MKEESRPACCVSAGSNSPQTASLWPSSIAAIISLLFIAAIAGLTSVRVEAAPPGYNITAVAFIGDPAPGPEGGLYFGDFEPYGLNERGEVSFAADLTTGGEGVFVGTPGHIQQIIRAGEPAPGGGTFGGFGIFSYASINSGGDDAFCFGLEPFTLPLGVNAGVYRYSHSTGTLSAILVPFVTPIPSGGVFAGGDFSADINNAGAVVFPGKIPGGDIDPNTPPGFDGLSNRIFLSTKFGPTTAVMRPGDPAPGGSVFDWGEVPHINDRGDIIFEGHVAGEVCIGIDQEPISEQAIRIGCIPGVFFKAAGGAIESIARIGDPAPGGGTFYGAIIPVLNNRGDVAFVGILSPPDNNNMTTYEAGVFLHTASGTTALARPGDAMPGGGTLLRASIIQFQLFINGRSDVVFSGTVNTDVNSDGIDDTGVWVSSGGKLRLVARTGTVVPGVGTLAEFINGFGTLPTLPSEANGGCVINNRGQVLFSAILSDGRIGLFIATPTPSR